MDDPVLSDIRYSEESNGPTIYYTILEDGVEHGEGVNVLNTENEFLGDNVLYLSFENEQDQAVIEQDEENEDSNLQEPLFQQITLPDGTHAYLKNETIDASDLTEETEDITDSLIQEPILQFEDLVNINADAQILSENKYDNSGDEGTADQNEVQDIKNVITVNADDTTLNESKEYEQIQLEDGSYAIIESGLYQSWMKQNKKKNQPVKEVNKAYDCPHENCNKAYTTMHHLRVHLRNHTGSRPYPCEYPGCGKAFSTGYSLKAHSRTHTGEKPYSCHLCDKSFKTSGDLQKHIRIHTGEKPFLCPIEGCGRSFTTSNIRKVHIRSHTGERPYECTEEGCDRAFASATNFKNHMRIHSGEKPYVCNVEGCGKRFTEYSSLYKHHLVHKNLKTFKCDFCGRSFRSPATLLSHSKNHSNVYVADDGTQVLFNVHNSHYVLSTNENQDDSDTQIVFVSE